MRLPQKGWSLFYIGCRRVVGRLRQSSASLHPPSGTSFLREPLTRPRPATLCWRLPATTQLFPGAVRAEKNRCCHFLVTKRPQLKRYPRLVELYFRKLVRNNFFVATLELHLSGRSSDDTGSEIFCRSIFPESSV